MGYNSVIEWTDATWNPVTGCTKVSQGCKHCYAERDWSRLAHLPAYQGRAFTNVACHTERLDQPLRWKRPRRIFVNSMSDLFHEAVPDDFIDKVFAVMALSPQHTFQVLTKRPERMRDYCKTLGQHNGTDRVSIAAQQISSKAWFLWRMGDVGWCLPNVWLGVSVEDQEAADQRIPLLLQTPAAVRWISAEPLLGPIDLRFQRPCDRQCQEYQDAECPGWPGSQCIMEKPKKNLDWVVSGGESGPKARPTHPDWLRSLRDQCASAGVPFLFKQWGEWSPKWGGATHLLYTDGTHIVGTHDHPDAWKNKTAEPIWRPGKRAAGRLLDGELHDGYPEAK